MGPVCDLHIPLLARVLVPSTMSICLGMHTWYVFVCLRVCICTPHVTAPCKSRGVRMPLKGDKEIKPVNPKGNQP